MKIAVLILLGILLGCSSAYGQTRIGLQAGAHGGIYHGVLPDSLRFKRGFGTTFGLHFEYEFTEDVAISINPQIVNERVRLQRLIRDEKKHVDSVNFTTQYYSLPVLAQIISDNRKFRYLAGLDLSFPQSVKSRDKNGSEEVRSDVLQNFNLGASFGIGWRKEINRSLITVDLIYNQGLLNLTSRIPEEPWYSQLKANSIRLTVGWSYDLSRKGGVGE